MKKRVVAKVQKRHKKNRKEWWKGTRVKIIYDLGLDDRTVKTYEAGLAATEIELSVEQIR